ncbi:MAG: hypothetical protein ACI865_000467 [Flavobacteriaceae bacterium]|jgi:hypothetical protein
MALSDVYDFYRRMEDEKVILSFKGEFTSELLTSILHIMESKMNKMGISTKMKKRVFNVLVECFQNLYHHIESTGEDSEGITVQKSALIMVLHEKNKIIVRTGNYIPNEGIEVLQNRLAYVNTLNEEELRELYQQRLLKNDLSKKGTAGLGLIDIARKSKNKLGFEFIEIDTKTSFFCLDVVIE